MYRRIKKQEGFTLIELIIVIVLFSILAIAVFWTFVVGLRAWGSGMDRAIIRQDANLAIERMVRDLSQASSITTADAEEITFVADVDEDGTDETVTFNVSNSQLIRTVDTQATILAPNVQTFGLSYRDLDDSLLSLPQDTVSQAKRDKIRVIIISLAMNNVDETITLSSSVYARNQGL